MSETKYKRDKKKQLGQFMTPENLASKLIERRSYKITDKILEPSFGKGGFLFPIIDSLIKVYPDSFSKEEKLDSIFQNNIFGVELDTELYEYTLNEIEKRYSYKDEGITDEEYACQPDRGNIDMNDPDWFIKSVEHAKTQKDWYSWNNSNWGTKWDVAVRDDDEYPNTELLEYKSEGHDNWLVYKYETAWSPAVTILTKLSNLVPNCLLTLEFEEETGWGGEYEIVRGNVTELVEYENRCYACQSYDTLSYCEDECGEFCSECNEGSWQSSL